MNIKDLLLAAESRGVALRVDGDNLTFRAPKGALTPELRDALVRHKADVLAFLQAGGGPARAPIPRAPVEETEPSPLSPGQARLWFLDRLVPGSPLYNVYFEVRMRGALDEVALRASLTAITERHAMLRATFPESEGRPSVVVAPARAWDLPVVDLRHLELDDRDAELRRLSAEHAAAPFDLTRGPLMRTTLVALGDEDHVLLVGQHHIITDGWSIAVFLRDLAELYRRACAGEPRALSELPIRHVDHVRWQEQELKREDARRSEAWWKEQLAELPRLELPVARAPQAGRTHAGDACTFALSAELTARLKSLAARESCTLFVALLTAWATLLHRYSQQVDFGIGTVTAGRDRSELRDLIGFFVNTLVLRCDLSGDPDAVTLMGRLRGVVEGALRHQEVPFDRIVNVTGAPREQNVNPLFRACFVLDNMPLPDLSGEGREWTPTLQRVDGGVQGTAKFDLSLAMVETEGGLRATIEYTTDLFDAATIERMAGHYQTLLESLVAEPSRRVSELPLLTEAERQKLQVTWKGTEAESSRDACLHALFEAQVEKTPDAVAVAFEGQKLTYRALDARANQLGRYLRRLGVGPDVLVGLCVERSLEMVVGLLGILKAGGAYVPLDPTYPRERLSFMLEDTGAPVLLTQQSLVPQLEGQAARVLCLDADWAEIARESDARLEHEATGENLAYVIYTSGSSGRPKGVQVTHGNVVRLFTATQAWFHFDASDVWTLFHSYAFDFSVWEIWGALLHGGRLVVVPFEVSRSPQEFHRLLCREGVTVLNQTPSAFRALVAADASATEDLGRSLRLVVFGGEAVDLPSLRPWFERHGDRRPQLVNMYGITETTVHVTYRPLSSSDLEGGSSSPVGRAIPDLQVYVLDGNQQLLPIGVPGELYVGGAGVARGYLNRPELTAERFIQDPFRGEPGAQLYRTGDLGRWLPDGELEHLGRIDHQVKIRGFRIELGEIESVLAQHPAVRDAVVIAREDAPGDKRLVAYLVAREAPLPTVSELRSHVQSKLPEYMVPAAFVELSALPLTVNGKLDREALPAPGQQRPELQHSYVAPRTPEEELLAEIWAEVLKIEHVGIDDNFFELGGDSILSIQVLSRAQAAGLSVSLQTLFQHQTIRELSLVSTEGNGGGQAAPVPSAFALLTEQERLRLPAEVEDAYPLAKLQSGMIFHSDYVPESSVYHDVFSYHLDVALDPATVRLALDRLAAEHPTLRTSFDFSRVGEPLQLVHRAASIPLFVEDLSALPAEEQEAALSAWMEEEKRNSFDPAQPPLMRVYLHRRSARTTQLTLSFHHAIVDGWSVAALVTELMQLFAAFSRGEQPALQPPSSLFRDFVALERSALASDEARRYWAARIDGAALATLPRGQAAAPAAPLRIVDVPIPKETSRALKKLAHTAAVPIKSVLLAAHVRVLSALSGQGDVVTGLVANGRPETHDAERALGLYLNTLPFRQQLHTGSWFDLARETFAIERSMLPHRRYPLAEIQRRHGAPLFDVIFNFVHFHVYKSLGETGLARVLGVRLFEQTNFKLAASFSLDLKEADVNLQLSFAAPDLSDEQVEEIRGYYARTLEAMAREPSASPLSTSVLSPEELHRILVTWNATEAETPRDTCIHALFEAQAEKTPDAVAVVFEGQKLTYRELNERANQLARHLRRLGVGPDVLVGLCVERSLEMVVGLLGILKAGGAYVPLDPAYPTERLAFMLEDTGAPILLTQGRLVARLPEHRARVLALDSGWDPIARERVDNPLSGAGPDNLAYVIYTSGSTGRPKGVMIPHGALVNQIVWIHRRWPLGPAHALLHKTPLSFDASVWELWGPLVGGARIVLALPGLHGDPAYLVQAVIEHGITDLQLVPSVLALVTEEPALGRCASLRRLYSGGEALSRSLVERIHASLDVEVINLYGPTEVTIQSVAHVAEREPTMAAVMEPIGRPIDNLRAYVLDRHLQPLPAGVAGELHLGGAGVSRGYLNRPELTAERFIQDPFRAEPGARLYKTGDLCRWLPDGTLEYLGRLDHQVKVRGFRIELGEVESVLVQHPAVREAVVVAREDAPGDKRLVAYVVAREAPLPTVSELRSYVQSKLPEHMVPAAFVELSALPLTANGKLDHKALPAPEQTRPEQGSAFVAPRTPVEDVLAGIWSKLLRIQDVGVEDNFFTLGGDSILAIQVISQAQQAGLRLSVRQIFQHQTIAALAELAEVTAGPTAAQGVVTGPVALTPIQRWFFELERTDPHHYNQAVLLEVRERLKLEALERAVRHLVHHHDALRLRFRREGAAILQSNAGADEAVTVATVDLSAVAVAEQAPAIERAAAEVQASLCLETGPLMQVVWLDLGPERSSRLLWVIHHLAVDWVSWRILLEDLETCYRQACRGEALRLPPKTTSFQQWAERLTAYAHAEATQQELSYWRSLRETAALPVDHAGGADTVASARTVTVELSVEETRALLQDVPEVYRTQINDVLLTALGQALARWTGTRRLRIDLEGHGREEIASDLDLSRTVGWFTTLFPVVLDMPEAPVGEVLKAVKEQLRGIPQRGLGHGLLRYLHEDARTRAELAAARPAQVSFNYLGQLDASEVRSSLFGFTAEPSGPAHSPRAARTYLLDINGWVLGGRLHMAWTYSDERHRRATIEGVAQEFLRALRALVAHCRSSGAGGRTPADFPLARLTQATVDRLVGTGKGVEDVYPLSPTQQGMLFHVLRDEGEGVYVQQLTFRVTAGLRVAEFEAAWRAVVERHATLRSTFVWEGLDEPLQVVRSGVVLPLAVHDWRGVPASEHEARLSAFLQEDRARGFELAEAPLMRLTLLRLGEGAYQVVWSFHHLLLDGWSTPLVFRDLLVLYETVCQGRSASLPPARPYRDYIAWLKQQDRAPAAAFWREALWGFRAPTPLPGGRSSGQGMTPAEQEQRLPASTTEALETFARGHGLTLSTVFQGAWALLLSRYSGEDDVVFGTTRSGRSGDLPGLEAMVGLFINTLPVRARVSPELPVVSWLKQLQEQQAEQLPHAYSSLSEVQGWSEVPRGQALFETLLVVENYPVDEALRKGEVPLAVEEVRAIDQTGYPLTVAVEPGREILLKLSYHAERFDAATIERIAGHYQTLLEGLVVEPSRRVSELSLLTEAERHTLLATWNATEAEYPRDTCIHALLEAQVEKTPDAVAVAYEGQTLTYRELNARANQLGHHLRRLGVGPDVLVGLCVERSLEMVVGLLGILKAGGAYVPLDPTYPAERLAFMLEDAAVPVLLTQDRVANALPVTSCMMLCLDTDWEPIARERQDNPVSGALPEHLAYVIYTSGSTGTPKGVMIAHRGLVNYLWWCARAYDVAGGQGAPVHSSLSFDLTITGLFSPLLVGRPVVLMPEQGGVEGLVEVLEGHEDFSLVKITPAHLELLQRLLPRERAAGRALALIIGGEALSWEALAFFQTHAPATRLVNEYGPTETVVGCCVYEAPADGRKRGPVPIGRPIANTQLYVLDAHRQPVPIGVPGELYIGGAGVARGYLNRPELTAERFIEDPFRAEPGARLYKTGDLCRWLPDGTLEYLGRLDHQVKVRGFRIELGEIESVLVQHPSVREAVVVAREDAPGDKRLVAYVVAREAPLPAVSELRSYVQSKLPEYMVPAAFVELSALPLTANGKVDRKALPAPDQAQTGQGSTLVAPRTPVEEVLAGIWAEVLHLERVSVLDSFFDLGGHSLLATQVLGRLRPVFGVDVPLRALFDAPTVAGLATHVEAALGQGALSTAPPLVPVPREGALPLSFAQQRLWFLDRLEPGSAFYNVPAVVRLSGWLDVDALARSLQEVVRRHEALRTAFPTTLGGEAHQAIASAFEVCLPVVDLQAFAEPAREAEMHRRAVEEGQKPFDLAKGPLLRTTLLRLGEQEHVLLLTMHHIVSDGWSLGVLVRELGALYEAFSNGVASPLPELPIQYADHAVWQRAWLSGEVLEAQLAYWRQQLSGAPPALELPTDRPRRAVHTYRGAALPVALPRELSTALAALSRREGVTLFMTLLAAFQVLLHRYTGQDDIVVGSPIAGRTHPQTEGLIGFFINTLVLRTDLSLQPTVRELLGRVREVTLGAYAHQEVPFEKLVEELSPARDLSRTPLFQVMFVLQNAPMPALVLGDVELAPVETEQTTAKFELTLAFGETEEGLRGALVYNTDLFDAATIERMAGHYQTLLEGLVAEPGRRVSELPLLTEAERQKLLVTWNATEAEYPRDACIHTLFEAQVEETPDAVALVFEGQQLTYRELNARANQLAHRLRRLGVGPDVLVGLCVERSLEMVVGLLGILKAGGAYVPLDPTYPRERLTFMLEDTGVPVLLTQERLAARLPEHRAHVLALDTGWDCIAGERQDNPLSGAVPDNLAYVIYTSGSTGRPKGVMNTHTGILNRLSWMQKAYALTEHDRILQKTPFSFDVSVWEFFWPLMVGARLVLATPEGHRDSGYLVRLIAEQKITTLHFVPSMLAAFVEEAGLEHCLSLKRVFASGEALPPRLVDRFFERSGAELHNLYGPTEAAVDVTFWACRAGEVSVPIGAPVDNVQIHLLDEQMQAVPVGVPGELYIGGVQVARGYLSRAGLTAERFVPDPFHPSPGARLYRTGDLARRRADGVIEYLGRLDHQVKVRGFRIELGEIESALGQHPSVREAAVVVREDAPGDRRLVAYLVAREAPLPAVSELRSYVQSKLPEYMVPAAFVELSALPLTPNGKVDRKALPAPDQAQTGQGSTFVAPRTPVEEVLAGIWAEVLHLERVSVRDSFFDLGGHSLLATQVLGRLRPVFGVDVPLRALFDAPTVAGLATHLEAALGQGALSTAPPLVPVPREGALPLSFAQQRLWFLDRLEPDSAFYNVPAVVRLSGRLDVGALARSLQEVVRRHEALRTVFPTTLGGEAHQAIASAFEVSLPIVDVQEPEVRRRAEEEAQVPFDLAKGPLLRTTLLRLGEQEHVLLLTLHHIVSDGWSLGVLVRELGALYEAFSKGLPSPLPALPIQYVDYAVWQRAWLSGEVLEAQLAYWRQQLSGAPPALELPTDRPRPAVHTYRGAILPVALPRELSTALAALSRREGVTLFMTLLAAFQVLLHRYTGQDDIVVGSPIAGRTHAQTEGLIGFFINTLVLRTDLSRQPTVRELLGRVREVTLGAYAHQEVPFEKLVDELSPARDLSRTPLFQVMFVLQNAPMPALVLGDVELAPVEIEQTTAKFELTLALQETEEGLRGMLEYNTDLFDAATIERMAGHYQTLLEGLVAEPGRRVSELPLLTEAERQKLLATWNATEAETPRDACLHALFEAQVEKTPDAVALVYEGQKLTYRELDARANQLAHHLQRLGVGPDVLVGLCVERSLEMVVGLLGILKAGGAYVPLDPTYPAERLAFMLEDTGAPVLLTQQSLVPQLEDQTARVLCLDADWAEVARESDARLEPEAAGENLAYVIYTSGSSGRPKGVQVSHGNVVRLFTATQAWFHFDAGDVWTLFHSYAFDFSVWEIWGALLHGGRLVVVPFEVSRSPQDFHRLLCREGVTVLNQTPSAFRALVAADASATEDPCRSLRLVIFGGEAVDLPSLRPWFERHGDRRPQLVNMYGITETTVHVTYRPLSSSDLDGGSSSPVGRPIPDLQVYVLDGSKQLVPIGVPGELYVGGAGVARGYLNRPELTAERFIQDPFRAEPGARLYRTGDLGRWLPDGELEHLGRIDHQVKIRGFRIELGEIESVLAQHPAVRDAVVIAREDTPGDKRLVAYLVAREAPLPTVSELRSHVQSKLPEYMVPAAFVELSSLPLTANGKLDREALPAPGQQRPELQHSYIAPRTPEEELLAEIWAEVLKIEHVGIDDNFFELGGDSILSIQVLSRAQAAGLSVSLQMLFQHQTIRELSLVSTEGNGGVQAAPAPSAFALLTEQERLRLPAEVEDAYPLAKLQSGMIFHSEYLAGSSVYHDVFSCHLDVALDPATVRLVLDRLAVEHLVLRTSFDFSQFSEPLQLVHRAASIPLFVEDLSALPAEEQEAALSAWMEEEKRNSFDPAQPPLMRVYLHRRSARTTQLTLSFHHAIVDGWSVATLLTELMQLFAAFSRGEQRAPRPPSSLFRDFVALERSALASDEARRYWAARIDGAALATLPRGQASAPAAPLRIVDVPIPKETSRALKKLAHTAAVPVKSVLLAAHVRVLSALSGQGDVVTGLVANGRPETHEAERAVGLYLNTLPFRQQLRTGSWLDLARETFAVERSMLPHRRYPLAEIQRMHGGPLFDVIFNFVHFHVYKNLGETGLARVLDARAFEQTNFKLVANFSLDLKEADINLQLSFAAPDLSDEQVEEIRGYYARTLEAMAREPSASPLSTNVLSQEEVHRILVTWNATEAEYPRDACLHTLFEVQVEETPDAVAVVYEGQKLTYRELNARANQLAHHLRRLGVGPEVLVGLCVERSLEMVVGLLGILKAGGAYVPLDPAYPAERLSFMLEDTRVPVLLTQGRLVARLPEHRARVLALDTGWDLIAGERVDNPLSGAGPDNLAYVIYTSGSTGRPKGVMNTHAGILNRLWWMQKAYALTEHDRIQQKTPFSFDVSVWEFFWPLMVGARLVLAIPEGHRDSGYLVRLIDEQKITTLHFVPSMLAAFVEEAGLERCLSLKRVFASGEALPPRLVDRFFERSGAELHNLYGPTEAAVDVTFWACRAGEASVPIGAPVDNVQIHLLDEQMQAVPVGVPGELYIGGVQVARGYLSRPGLTAERFVPDPFHPSPGARLYRTGDLARRRADGVIEYLGRLDHQVKVRGFRIELGEIESALGQHPSVREAAVVVREDAPGDKRLVAYLVAREAPLPTASDLRSYMQSKLPEYMVPAAFVELHTLPLTPNGKLDRKALPAPEQARPERGSTFVAPRTSMEAMLAGIWAEVLHLERVSVLDNFFELGGHSLLATQVLGRVRATLGVGVPLHHIFRAPTLTELAEVVEATLWQSTRVEHADPVERVEEGEL
ncbi:non-ribosomal peptide synthase/polyketide synthase [Sorangium sp. So ce118]